MAEGVFQVGDVVALKSSGPDMVVEIDWKDGSYKCSWFAGEKHQSQSFVGATLKKVD